MKNSVTVTGRRIAHTCMDFMTCCVCASATGPGSSAFITVAVATHTRERVIIIFPAGRLLAVHLASWSLSLIRRQLYTTTPWITAAIVLSTMARISNPRDAFILSYVVKISQSVRFEPCMNHIVRSNTTAWEEKHVEYLRETHEAL